MRGLRLWAFLLLAFASVAGAQSLAELAKREKERREKNKDAGKKVHVIDQTDLSQGEPEVAEDEDGATARPAPTTPVPSPRTSVSRGGEEEDEEVEEDRGDLEPPSTIALDADLQQRLRDFDRMKRVYDQQVKEIDTKIAENEKRLAEIEQRLSSLGAGGLPVAPQADREARNPGDFYGLLQEKGKLTEENQRLEAQKQTLKRELIEKGRRGNIPAGQLRF